MVGKLLRLVELHGIRRLPVQLGADLEPCDAVLRYNQRVMGRSVFEDMFDKELAFFIAHQDELVQKHQGKVLVIRDEHIEGVYASPLEAYLSAQKRFPAGTFMIQPCEPGPDAYTVTINSMSA